MSATEELLTVECAATGKTASTRAKKGGEPALPPGWKEIGGATYSPEGVAARFVLRSVTLPVASVVEGYDPPDWSQERRRQGWAAFRPAVRDGQRQCVQLGNRLLFDLAGLDTLPLVDSPKGKALPNLAVPGQHDQPAKVRMPVLLKRLYEIGRNEFPDLDSQAMGALRQRVLARYKDCRFEVRVLGRQSLPTYRRLPLPVPAASLRSLSVNDQNQPFVALRIGGTRFTLRLRSGHSPRGDYRRAVTALARVGRGEGLLGEVSIQEVPVSQSARHRGNGSERRDAPGANRVPTDFRVRVACWLPRPEREEREGVLVCRTQPDCLWRVWVEGRDHTWQLSEDHARRRVAAHRLRLLRFAGDTKFERRRPKSNQVDLDAARRLVVDAHHNWEKNALHQWSAFVVGLARRHRVETLKYDDMERGWCELPWFKLRSQVAYKCDEFGISFEHVGGSDDGADAGVLDDDASDSAD